MDNDLCARYYQKNKENLQKRHVTDFKMVASNIKTFANINMSTFLNIKNKSWLSIEYYEFCKSFMQ